MKTNKKELMEYFKYSIKINLESFEGLARKYLEYKLVRVLEYEKIELIEVGLDHLMPEKMYAKFKVDEFDIVIKMSIYDTNPDEPYVLVECDECHERNERPFCSRLELLSAINYGSSHMFCIKERKK